MSNSWTIFIARKAHEERMSREVTHNEKTIAETSAIHSTMTRSKTSPCILFSLPNWPTKSSPSPPVHNKECHDMNPRITMAKKYPGASALLITTVATIAFLFTPTS